MAKTKTAVATTDDVALADRLRDEAGKLRDEASAKARAVADSGRDKTATMLGGVAQTAHETAEKLGAQTSPEIAKYVHRAADALDSLSASLRAKSVDDLIDDTGAIIRRNPAAAFAAAAVIGFALARFLRAGSGRGDS